MSTPSSRVSMGMTTMPPPRPVSAPSNPAAIDPLKTIAENSAMVSCCTRPR
jgi:hypothetical protein